MCESAGGGLSLVSVFHVSHVYGARSLSRVWAFPEPSMDVVNGSQFAVDDLQAFRSGAGTHVARAGGVACSLSGAGEI